MAHREFHSDIKAVSHLDAAAYTSTQIPSNGVDLQGFDAAEFVISIGTVSNLGGSPLESWTFKLQESDDESSNFTDVTDSDSVVVDSAASPVTTPDSSSGVFLTVDAAAEDDAVYRIGYVGGKRYARCVATANNTPGSTPIAIHARLGCAAQKPVQD